MEPVLRTGNGTDTLGPTLKWVQNVYSLECTMHMMCMGKDISIIVTWPSYRIFIQVICLQSVYDLLTNRIFRKHCKD
jgi:hypothetical protein